MDGRSGVRSPKRGDVFRERGPSGDVRGRIEALVPDPEVAVGRVGADVRSAAEAP
jgi:hypothetical protein